MNDASRPYSLSFRDRLDELKIILVGETNVGKTSLTTRVVDSVFVERHIVTVGCDLKVKTLNLNQAQQVKLKIYDVGGNPRLRMMGVNYYQDADGIMLVYDVSSISSFTNLITWVTEVTAHAPHKVPKILIGNKMDLDRAVPFESAFKLAKQKKMEFLETSAKTGENVEEAFTRFSKTCLDWKTKCYSQVKALPSITEEQPTEKSGSCCCAIV